MAKICPVTKKYVLYLDCLECEEKECMNNRNSSNIDSKENIKIDKDKNNQKQI